MACAWHVQHGMCMACAWHVHGMCMACAWHVHGSLARCATCSICLERSSEICSASTSAIVCCELKRCEASGCVGGGREWGGRGSVGARMGRGLRGEGCGREREPVVGSWEAGRRRGGGLVDRVDGLRRLLIVVKKAAAGRGGSARRATALEAQVGLVLLDLLALELGQVRLVPSPKLDAQVLYRDETGERVVRGGEGVR
jgi:hypothetical protein